MRSLFVLAMAATLPMFAAKPPSSEPRRTPFVITTETLSPHFAGAEPFAVATFFLSHPKNEMETSAEYDRRMSSTAGECFAFQIPDALITYDADNEKVSVTVDGYKKFTIEKDSTLVSHYVGQNALGVKVRVSVYSAREARVIWAADRDYTAPSKLTLDLPMARAVAEQKKKHLRALAVVGLTGHDVSTYVYHLTPEINRPTDVRTKHYEMNGDPFQIWIYDFETGEVLLRKLVRDSKSAARLLIDLPGMSEQEAIARAGKPDVVTPRYLSGVHYEDWQFAALGVIARLGGDEKRVKSVWPKSLQIGMKPTEVRSLLGDADSANEREWRYEHLGVRLRFMGEMLIEIKEAGE
ncbi:MAG TPA: hypothetical protein VLC46_24945 [Thermoanaerobaculia bacterium]|jgi:hypothetical protein|nr:hypothetical protein [Thermoanaerobaculia bacterium]